MTNTSLNRIVNWRINKKIFDHVNSIVKNVRESLIEAKCKKLILLRVIMGW